MSDTIQVRIDYNDLDYIDELKRMRIGPFVILIGGLKTVDLGRLLAVFEDGLASINDQLARERKSPSKSDNWRFGALRARSGFASKITAIQAELGDRKRDEAIRFERAFISAARLTLDKETYIAISDLAHVEKERIGNGEN